jgi:[protein-PII] uridylyltransferase
LATTPRIHPAASHVRAMMLEGRAKARDFHDREKVPGVQVCAQIAELIDRATLYLLDAALDELRPENRKQLLDNIALVPHGGYGRRETAPYSDVDLMLLYTRSVASQIQPLARLLTMLFSDSVLTLGLSVRTLSDVSTFARSDATVFTSLAESRLLAGNKGLFTRYFGSFRRLAMGRSRKLIEKFESARLEERPKYGDTPYLLRPNVKRSSGGLRDIQMVRWIGFAKYGENEIDALHRAGVLTTHDRNLLRDARDFLLHVRNELHFQAGKSADVLEKHEQVRIAKKFGYESTEALHAVEGFMREYFRHTSSVQEIVSNFAATAKQRSPLFSFLGDAVSRPIGERFLIGPYQIGVRPKDLPEMKRDLCEVLRLLDFANRTNRHIEHGAWKAIREALTDERQEIEVTDEARQLFLQLLSEPGDLGRLLRRLHEIRALEKLVPAVEHARNLVQFNEYHKFTVDEHSILAVQAATNFRFDDDVVGQRYRDIADKELLHLALLLHDLGKGFPEDHSIVGERIAEETADLFRLSESRKETLKFLVRQHLAMSHLAQFRNIDDPEVVVPFAADCGTPDRLKLLFVLTCADMQAVGPGVLNEFKRSLLTTLYFRANEYLAGEFEFGESKALEDRKATLLAAALKRVEATPSLSEGERERLTAWWKAQTDVVPRSMLVAATDEEVLAELGRLQDLKPDEVRLWSSRSETRNATEIVIGVYETIAPGLFYKLTGALASERLEILGADINTLADGLALDRFYVRDLNSNGEFTKQQEERLRKRVIDALTDPAEKPPSFPKFWGTTAPAPTELEPEEEVHSDNNSSSRYTVLDVFARDRSGLLYEIAREIWRLGLSVRMAKIGTHLDQVVDVFYVLDRATEGKIEDPERIEQIRESLLKVVRAPRPAPAHRVGSA